MKVFKACLRQQLHDHRNMTPQDVVKMCYQAAYGAEHLLQDLDESKRFFDDEYAKIFERDEPLFERISEKLCRVNLGAWKRTGMPSEWLFCMFTETVFEENGKEYLREYLSAAEAVLYDAGYDMLLWKDYIAEYESSGIHAVRHSEFYRQREKPAYRIVGVEHLKLLPILKRITEDAPNKRPYVIAIDGKAGAGKSTIAALLQKVLDAGMVYMDDFFLPPVMRTAERLEQTGGNIHYERFAEQIVPYLNSEAAFSYDVFDCGCMNYNSIHTVSEGKWKIVEGSYSHHPYFGEYMNLRVFVDVEAKEQLRRITVRNGEYMAEVFRTRWIPMEKRYFEEYSIRDKADVVIK